MNTSKAPDKIYVPIVDLGVEDGECPSPIWWKKDKSHEYEEVIGSITYIRKDALVKWIESIRLEYDLRELHDIGADSAMQHVLERINSL